MEWPPRILIDCLLGIRPLLLCIEAYLDLSTRCSLGISRTLLPCYEMDALITARDLQNLVCLDCTAHAVSVRLVRLRHEHETKGGQTEVVVRQHGVYLSRYGVRLPSNHSFEVTQDH